jgi:hypothetical protein
MAYQRGEARWCSKLTESQVREIRAALTTPCACCGALPTQRSLAPKYGVSFVMIHKIAKGESWKHLLSQHHEGNGE